MKFEISLYSRETDHSGTCEDSYVVEDSNFTDFPSEFTMRLVREAVEELLTLISCRTRWGYEIKIDVGPGGKIYYINPEKDEIKNPKSLALYISNTIENFVKFRR